MAPVTRSKIRNVAEPVIKPMKLGTVKKKVGAVNAVKTPVVKVKNSRAKKKLCAIAPGTVVTDLKKNTWSIEGLLGHGGFGDVYGVVPLEGKEVGSDRKYAIKLELEVNGTLFSEIAFYQRMCRKEKLICSPQKGIKKEIALPEFISSGKSSINGEDSRFLVMPRLDSSLEEYANHFRKRLSVRCVSHVIITLLDTIQYIQSNGYVHGDIKLSNVLTQWKPPKPKTKIYLTDFGLVSTYLEGSGDTGKHKVYKELVMRKHCGTLEYTSIDCHRGAAASRRTDVEVLGYIIIQLLYGELPWSTLIKNPEKVHEAKENFKCNMSQDLKIILKGENLILQAVENYFKAVYALRYEEEPNYEKLKALFTKFLRKTDTTGKEITFASR